MIRGGRAVRAERAGSGRAVFEQNGFMPEEITVNLGETVIFKNNRSQPMWVASDPHPVHTDYEGFDTVATLGGGYPKPGADFSFTFKKTGNMEVPRPC